MPEEKTKTETKTYVDALAAVPVSAPKAKVGDHVIYFVEATADGKNVAMGAILAALDSQNVACLKIPMPAHRKGGGGVKLLKGVKFSDKPAKGCWGV